MTSICRLLRPAGVSGFSQFAVRGCDYPAVVKDDNSSAIVHGYIIELETASQRSKLDNFEGEIYKLVAVTARLTENNDTPRDETVKADIYLWDGQVDALSSQP